MWGGGGQGGGGRNRRGPHTPSISRAGIENDAELMRTLIEYLGCGNYYLRQDIGEFIVKRCEDNLNKIIPFFDKYPLLGNKALDFADFKRAVELVAKKVHLTELGLEELRLTFGFPPSLFGRLLTRRVSIYF